VLPSPLPDDTEPSTSSTAKSAHHRYARWKVSVVDSALRRSLELRSEFIYYASWKPWSTLPPSL